MSIVDKNGILAIGGVIRDDPDPCKCCGCRDCRVAPRTVGLFCDCIPTQYLVVVAGLNANCTCFPFTIPPLIPPMHHYESSGNDYNKAYCFPSDQFLTPPDAIFEAYSATEWNGTGGGTDCGPPNGVNDFGTLAGIVLDPQFPGPVNIHFSILVHTNAGGEILIFDGRYIGEDCEGPWLISNDIADACVYDPFGAGIRVGGGGTAIVYPCQC